MLIVLSFLFKYVFRNARIVLSEKRKLDFVRKSVSWIQEGQTNSISFIKKKDIMDTCFVLNFGYEDPVPWPQVINTNNKLDLELIGSSFRIQ